MLRGEVSEVDIKACAALSPTEMQTELAKFPDLLKEGDYLFGDFAAMRAGPGRYRVSAEQKVIPASLLTMNAAWKSIQLGRAVNEQNPNRIDSEKSANFGTFSEMVRAMYRQGVEKSGGDKKIGILRAVFELAKDLKQIYDV